jgi:WD40 repeat protein/tetratricopeptide (TPR) repeat protein
MRLYFTRQAVAYSPDGRRVLTGGSDGCARLWTAATGQLVAPPLRHSWPGVYVMTFSPDGRLLATASQTPNEDPFVFGEVRLWDAATGRALGPPLPHANWVAALAFSPDGKVLVTGGYDSAVHFWDTAKGTPLGRPLFLGDIVQSLAFSPDGKILAVGHTPRNPGPSGLTLLNVAHRRRIGKTVPGPRWFLLFSPDGKRLLTADSGTLRLWNPTTGDQVGPTMAEAAEVQAIAFSPDGQFILSGSTDGQARLWKVSTGKPVGAPMAHSQRITAVAFSPDPQGRLLLTACADGSARLWDHASQKQIGPPVVLRRQIMAAQFTHDGRSFLTTAQDGSTRLWPVPAALEEDQDRLQLRLQVHTGLEMGPAQSVLPLNPPAWEERRKELAALNDSQSRSSGVTVTGAAFQEARARDAEQDGNWFAVRWHLDRLLAARARQADSPALAPLWQVYARRARTWALAGLFDQARADEAQALRLGSPAELLDWQRHCLAECLGRKQWQAALWYANQAIARTPGDWRLFADRAQAEGGLGQTAERAADRARAAALGAESMFLLQLADDYAREGRWQEAATASVQASERGPCPPAFWPRQALARLKVGDRAGYRKFCARLLAREGQTPYLANANSAAWVCALEPDGPTDYAPALALAERAARAAPPVLKHSLLNTLGAVLYRAGRYQEAVARLQEGIKAGGQGGFHDWVFLALAHHRLGHSAEAHTLLARAVKEQPTPGSAWERVELELLRAEAEALIEGKAANQDR